MHFKPPNLFLLLRPAVQQRIKTTKPLTARPQLISVTTLFTAPLSLPPHPTTHTHNPTLLTRALFEPHNPLFPHWSIHIRASTQTHLLPHARVTMPVTRDPCTHTDSQSSRRLPSLCLPAQSNSAPPSTPPIGRHAVSRLFSSVLFLKTQRILCLCFSQPRVSGRGKNAALRAVALPGATAPRYSIYLSEMWQNWKKCLSGSLVKYCHIVCY